MLFLQHSLLYIAWDLRSGIIWPLIHRISERLMLGQGMLYVMVPYMTFIIWKVYTIQQQYADSSSG
jgi:hypothetical protein